MKLSAALWIGLVVLLPCRATAAPREVASAILKISGPESGYMLEGLTLHGVEVRPLLQELRDRDLSSPQAGVLLQPVEDRLRAMEAGTGAAATDAEVLKALTAESNRLRNDAAALMRQSAEGFESRDVEDLAAGLHRAARHSIFLTPAQRQDLEEARRKVAEELAARRQKRVAEIVQGGTAEWQSRPPEAPVQEAAPRTETAPPSSTALNIRNVNRRDRGYAKARRSIFEAAGAGRPLSPEERALLTRVLDRATRFAKEEARENGGKVSVEWSVDAEHARVAVLWAPDAPVAAFTKESPMRRWNHRRWAASVRDEAGVPALLAALDATLSYESASDSADRKAQRLVLDLPLRRP